VTRYDPDDEPTWCEHGYITDAPSWYAGDACKECAEDACAVELHAYTGDVQDDHGIWHGTCECGHGRYPLGGPALDEEGIV
jgi:hypothetical protein